MTYNIFTNTIWHAIIFQSTKILVWIEGILKDLDGNSLKKVGLHKNSCGKYVYVEQENQNLQTTNKNHLKENHRLQTIKENLPRIPILIQSMSQIP